MAMRLGDIAEYLGAVLKGDGSTVVKRIDTLERADAEAVSFFSNRRYRKQLGATAAGAVILSQADVHYCPTNALLMDNAYVGYAKVARMLNPLPEMVRGVHATAVLAADCTVDPSASIGPNTVVGAGAVIGVGAYIGPNCVIEADVRIGSHCYLHANITLCAKVAIDDRVVIHPGAVLGADGFGIAQDEGGWIKIPQLGSVRIGNDVEIGANTCIDRGALEDTEIGDGVKIDNHVQIGHNVRIGEHTAIAGCVAIAGSARIGARCIIGGSSAISGHLEITDDVELAGGTNVPNSILHSGKYSSALPLQPINDWRKNVVRVKQLDDMARRLRALEAKNK